MNDEILKVNAVEIMFRKDKTIITTDDDSVYEIEPVMADGSRMVLEFFHNIIFPTNSDRILGTESDISMRN